MAIKKLWSHCVKKFLDSKSNEKKMKNLAFLIYVLQSIFSEILCLDSHDLCEKLQRNTPGTDKRTDVWSRDIIIWKINSGLWAVIWAGLWNKRVWADYEQLLRAFFFHVLGVKTFFFWKHYSVRTEKLHNNLFLKKIFEFFLSPKTWKNQGFL